MRILRPVCALLIATGLAMPAQHGWAQLANPPSPSAGPKGVGATVGVVILVVAALLILGALVKILDLKRKRESEALVVQARISDSVLHDRTLFSLPITPTAHVPLWKGSPVTIEVAGQVPSDDLRQTALRVVEREVAHLRPDVRIESRIVGVVPRMAQRSA
jgi:hypothetical protein